MNWVENMVEQACRGLSKMAPAHRVITRGDNEPYLERFYFVRREWIRDWYKRRNKETPWFVAWIPSVYLHHFLKGDDEEELHNHPWLRSYALILTVGYREDRRMGNVVVSRILRPGMINVIRAEDFHKVELLDKERGVWTIFIAGKRNEDESWGFWHPVTKLYQDWRLHVSNRELKNNVVWRGSKVGEA